MDLPELFPFHGDWNTYVEQLYEIYLDEIVYSGVTFRGWPVKSRYEPPTYGKGYGFWHVISDGPMEADRLPDLRRCERIRWVSWIIRMADSDDRIKWWENKRGNSTHAVLWLESHEFTVILAKRRNYYLLKTAYNVTAPHRKKSFRKEYERFWDRKKG